MIKYILLISFLLSSLVAKNPPLESMISQMIMVGVAGTKSDDKWIVQLKNDIQNDKIGGVILFARNLVNPKQVKVLTSFLSTINSIKPLFIAIDQEGGKVQRLSDKNGFNSYKSAFDIAREKTLEEAYSEYLSMANELKEYGFNVNFGPVVDLNINPESPAIGAKLRSYSLMEEIVISYSNEFINAHKKAGVISVLKHFPGHGSAISDSHKRLTDVSDTWKYRELKPYYHFIKYQKADAVMVGHITNKIFDTNYPASLSKLMIQELLRDKLKFDGVVFSDDMNMKAIIDIYSLKSSVIRAINAGVDVLVYSSYFTKKSSVPNEVRQIILDAVKNGDIKKETIENSYKRIMKLKAKI